MSPIAARGFNPPDPDGEFELHRLSVANALRNRGSRQEGLLPMETAGLGVESSDRDIMEIFPLPPRRPLMGPRLALRSYIFLGMIEAVAAMLFFFVLILGGWHYSVSLPTDSTLYRSATAACLTAIIVTQIVNVFVCRQCGSLRLLKAFARCVILAGVSRSRSASWRCSTTAPGAISCWTQHLCRWCCAVSTAVCDCHAAGTHAAVPLPPLCTA